MAIPVRLFILNAEKVLDHLEYLTAFHPVQPLPHHQP